VAVFEIAYDKEVDILTVTLGDLKESPGARELAPGVWVDVTADGRFLSVEVMGASKKYAPEILARYPANYHEPIGLAEAARVASTTPQALRKACERGRLAGKKIGPNWTTTVAALTAYINSRAHAGPRARADSSGAFPAAESEPAWPEPGQPATRRRSTRSTPAGP
jgi:uncharacterized protein YuzE